jgi:hypothetical protein
MNNDQLREELVRWMQQTGSFVADQAPKAANDLLAAGMIKHSALAICFAIVVLVCLSIGYAMLRKAKRLVLSGDATVGTFYYDVFYTPILTRCIMGCVTAIPTMVVLVNIYWMLVIHYAPRAYILSLLKIAQM